MIIWAHVDAGVVSEWRSIRPAGGWGNVSNIEALSDDEQAGFGWRPVAVTEDEIGPEQVAGRVQVTIDGEGVVTAHVPAVTAPVPDMVTNAQMRCAILATSQTMFSQIDGAANTAGVMSELYQRWNYANNFGRFDPFVLTLQGDFEKTDAEIDSLFRLAATK